MHKLVRYKKDHVFQIKVPYDLTDISREALSNEKDIVGYTLMDDDVILGMGGVHNMWDGVGEAWLVISEYGFDKPRTIAKWTNVMFDVVQEEYGYKRIQAAVSLKDNDALRFVKWMGFEEEGVMRKYGPDGSDYARYAKVN